MSHMKKEYFVRQMEARKLSMRGLASKMGLQHSQLSLMFSGKRKMTLEEAAQLSQIFGVPLHDIVSAAGVKMRPASGKRVSVVGYVGRDGFVVINPKELIERTDGPPNLPDSIEAIQFRTAEGEYGWADGWLCFYNPSDTIDMNSFDRLSFCKTSDGKHVIATVRRGYQPGTFNLSGFFSRQNVALESATPVLSIRP